MSQLPMMMFMFYMMGSGISIYTIMFCVQMAKGPFIAIAELQSKFEQFEHKEINLTMPKLAYFGLNLGACFFALYKFASKCYN